MNDNVPAPPFLQEVHVIPNLDMIHHIEDPACPCQPYWQGENQWDYYNGVAHKIVLVHRCVIKELQ